jgi:1,4-dihydroxy-2-naphthoate octaprenyltransferase
MLTTGTNNYLDYKKAIKKEGYNYEEHNAMVSHNMTDKEAKTILGSLATISIIFGIILVYRTDILVLFLGAISFLIGILYSYSRISINSTPFGELFSGFFMGFVIFFISIYIHNQNIVNIFIDGWTIGIITDSLSIIKIFMASIPLFAGISNIMLANNICDIEDDLSNNRHTMPIVLGKKIALIIFEMAYYIAFTSIIINVLMDILPIYSLLILWIFPFVYRNIKIFRKIQSKKDTFSLSVQNFLMISILYVLSLIAALFF